MERGGGKSRDASSRGSHTKTALLESAGRVFSQKLYGDAKLTDISDGASANPGSIFFHFGNKRDIAEAVLREHQERMASVLDDQPSSGPALERIIVIWGALARLIARDPIVQAGIRLSQNPPDELTDVASEPYAEWTSTADHLIREGVADGSVNPDIDVVTAAEFVNDLFVGAQVRSGIRTRWASLPQRAIALVPVIRAELAPHSNRA